MKSEYYFSTFLKTNKEPASKTCPNTGVDYVLCHKNGFINQNEKMFRAFDRDEVGASFEPYSMFIEHLQHIQKFKRFHLSNPNLAAFFS